MTESNGHSELLDPYMHLEAPKESSKNDRELPASELLVPSNELSWDILDLVQSLPNLNINALYDGMLNITKPMSRTNFRFKRRGIHGNIEGYSEETQSADLMNADALNSLSINRKLGSKVDSVRGQMSNLPFQPGGIFRSQKLHSSKDESAYFHRNEKGLFDIPQGFLRGLQLNPAQDSYNILEQETASELDESQQNTTDEHTPTGPLNLWNDKQGNNEKILLDEDDVEGSIAFNISSMKKTLEEEKKKSSWAHIVDLEHKIDNFNEVVPDMAREFPFELDTFQQEAIYHLEQGDSVFVAAHTSAGKTVIAEYAIAMAKRNMTKAIYTSPIKALSNQKFRDFKETFKDIDVGLITGDVQINPEANCLIMTTEILRSMLYRGADLIRDVEFVIFDEVHYVNDIDRGVVWEEVIIMLPNHIKYILLSATVPNTFEFANWVGRTKQKDIYVISTPKRPVPLEIFIWAKNNMYKAVDSQRKFSEIEFKKHKSALEGNNKNSRPNTVLSNGSRGGRGGTARGGNRGNNLSASRGRGNISQKSAFMRDGPNKGTWSSLVQHLRLSNLLPVVIFVFSKKKCEEYADTLKGVDFCTGKEKSEIHNFIDKAVSRLRKEDRELPQIMKIRELLGRGIAVHHGGLLPIVKECIEILFSKSLVRVLFATETFAMGLNLPTRTVVFSSYRKHDGRGFRNLLPGEFTQMSGRAGRRGLDTTGTVIIMAYNEPLSPTAFKEITLGVPTKLHSQFRLTYNMILNLLRIEALRVEEMIKHSFSENSTQTLLPEHQERVKELQAELDHLEVTHFDDCPADRVELVYELLSEYDTVFKGIVEQVQQLPYMKNKLYRVGRLLCYDDANGVTRIGFFLRSDIMNNNMLLLTCNLGDDYENESKDLDLPWIPNHSFIGKFMNKMSYTGGLRIDSVSLDKIKFIGDFILKFSLKLILRNEQTSIEELESEIKQLLKFQRRWRELNFRQASQLNLYELLDRKEDLIRQINSTDIFDSTHFKDVYKQVSKRNAIVNEIKSLQSLISDENLELLPEYTQRLEVLRLLEFIDQHHNVVLKGRVACEINSGWELIITELILDNFLGEYEPEEIVALLSCFVYEGRNNEKEEPCVTPRLERGRKRIMSIAEKLTKIYALKRITLTMEEEEFFERNRFALVNVVYEWARGMSFNEIMQISLEAEGTIVRVITRLDEVCRQVKNAALIIGDSILHLKMSEAQEKIKRDIVFCASLYL